MTQEMFLDLHIGCFGEFNLTDPVCSNHCALRIRCAVENELNTKMELLEDLISGTDDMLRLQ
jgi:hypothetical protein